jgi:predicted metalloprotease with PDZ domain
MEHRNSTVVASAVSFRNPKNVRLTLDTVSHEFFHCWNVERIRPRTLEPFNFEEANISGELWLAEGFTQYYGPLVIARAGLSPGEQGAGLVRNAVAVINAPGRQFHSPVEMSQMAPFSDAAVAIDETNFSNTYLSYYTYGAGIATALDLSLRERSGGRVTLDDFMRAMWVTHGKPGGPSPAIVAKPYTLKDARDRLAEVSGDRRFADEFFDKYIEGREAPDYATLLGGVGLVLRKTNPGGAWAGLFDGDAIGVRGRRRAAAPAASAQGGALRIPTLVPWGSPAFLAGLEEDDLINAVEGAAITGLDDWYGAIRARKPGDRIEVAFTRHGTPMKTTITLAEDPAVDVATVEATGGRLTPAQKSMREAWLAPRRK